MSGKIQTNLTHAASDQSRRMFAEIAPDSVLWRGELVVDDEQVAEPVVEAREPQVLPAALSGRVRTPAAMLAVPVFDHLPVGPLSAAGALIAAAGVAVAAGQIRGVVYGRRYPRVSREVRVQWRVFPGPGFAGRWTLWRRYGRHAARKVAKHGRPSLSWKDRHFGPANEYATYHGRAQGWIHRWGVYGTFEMITLVIAPPQEGKSSKAAASIIDAPGPVVVTSIRGDLIAQTAGLRQQLGQLHVWNPEGAGKYGSTLRWNPVAGCQDAETALRRAGYLVAASDNRGLSDADFWADQAHMLLAALMHAAGLIGANLRTVHQWLVERSDDPVKVLADHPGANEQARMFVTEWLQMTEKTRDSVVTTLNRVLRFMSAPGVVEMLSPAAGVGFDFAAFLEGRDTLYLVSETPGKSVCAPLFTAFLGELAEYARAYGAKRTVDGQLVSRLDPPLSMELDEVANIAPIPVDTWASWAAGSGIRITLYLQSWAQARARYGHEGADGLWAACKMKVIFSGVSEPELMHKVSQLAGRVRVRERTDEIQHDRNGRQKKYPRYSDIDVIPEASVRETPPGFALVIAGSAKPTTIKVENVRGRRDFKRWTKNGEPIRLAPVQPRAVPLPMPEIADRYRMPEIPSEIPDDIPGLPFDEIGERRARRHGDRAPVLPPPPGQETHTVPSSFGGRAGGPSASGPSPESAAGDDSTAEWWDGGWNPWERESGGGKA